MATEMTTAGRQMSIGTTVTTGTLTLQGATPLALCAAAGVSRLTISVDSTNTTYQTASGNILRFIGAANAGTISTGLIQFSNLSTFSTNTAGTSVFFAITPTINSSATGANTDFLINRTQTGTGSGNQYLLDLQVGGTSKFNVDNNGTIASVGNFYLAGSINNSSTANNSRAVFQAAGTLIDRNIADGNTCLTINQSNTASTGKILATNFGGVEQLSISTAGKVSYITTKTPAGTTGSQTINNPTGTVNFAAAASSLVVTNSTVTTNSSIFCTIRTNDATALIKNVVPAAGSFTITLNAAATAETSVGFLVIN